MFAFPLVLVWCELELIRVIIKKNVQLKDGFMLNCDKLNSMLNPHCNISVASLLMTACIVSMAIRSKLENNYCNKCCCVVHSYEQV